MRGIAELAPRSREQARKDDTKSRTKHHQFGGMIFQTIGGTESFFNAYARQPLKKWRPIGKGAKPPSASTKGTQAAEAQHAVTGKV